MSGLTFANLVALAVALAPSPTMAVLMIAGFASIAAAVALGQVGLGLGLGLFKTKDKCGFTNKYVRHVAQLVLPGLLGLGLLSAIDLDST